MRTPAERFWHQERRLPDTRLLSHGWLEYDCPAGPCRPPTLTRGGLLATPSRPTQRTFGAGAELARPEVVVRLVGFVLLRVLVLDADGGAVSWSKPKARIRGLGRRDSGMARAVTLSARVPLRSLHACRSALH
jgi:hypothetical protein